MTHNFLNPSKNASEDILYQNADATQQTSRFAVFQAYQFPLANNLSLLPD
jgi:hypothetical protein